MTALPACLPYRCEPPPPVLLLLRLLCPPLTDERRLPLSLCLPPLTDARLLLEELLR